jgi:hypothetical protein
MPCLPRPDVSIIKLSFLALEAYLLFLTNNVNLIRRTGLGLDFFFNVSTLFMIHNVVSKRSLFLPTNKYSIR